MKLNKCIDSFAQEGYVVLDLLSKEELLVFKNLVLSKLKELLNNKDVTFESFHKYIQNDEQKIDIQYQINKMIWDEKLHHGLMKENLKLYYNLIGKDLDLQSQPYLRVARPNCPQDNIGFHRDSFYGSSPYEISSFIPLVNLDEKNALQIEPQSHKKGPIPYTKIQSSDVVKGDKKSQLGFQYAPKHIDKDYHINKIPVPLKFGQVLIFGLGVIHGQENNESSITRWSIDIRVKNSFAGSNVKSSYYESFTLSPVGESARIFYENNPLEN